MCTTKQRRHITQELSELQGNRCYYCGDEIHFESGQCPDRATFDHIVLASNGGEVSKENGVAACLTCNSLRGDIHWLKWISFIRCQQFKDCVRNVKLHRRTALEKIEQLDKELEATRERLQSLQKQRDYIIKPTKKVVRRYKERFLKSVA